MIDGSWSKLILLLLAVLPQGAFMEIKYRIRGADGTLVDNLIHNTIHAFGADED